MATKKPKKLSTGVTRVAVRWDRELRGRVVAVGPEQTEVLLDGACGRQHTRFFPNSDLVPLVERHVPRRRVRE